MNPQDLPPRGRMAAVQLRRGTFEMPWSAATWTSVVRRTVVVAAFFGYGLYSGNLDTAIFGAFGALQLGLGEAVVPLRGLVRLLAVQVVFLVLVGYAAASLGGTWWTVPLLAGVAFIHGATVEVGLVERATGIGALAMGVIFAGLPGLDPSVAALWLGIGAAVQGVVWLLFWHRERALSIRRALANSIRHVARIAAQSEVSGRESNTASAGVDRTRAMILASGIRHPEAALAVADATNEIRRSVIAWRVLKRPGLAGRLAISQSLLGRATLVDESLGFSPLRPVPAPAPGEPWACATAVRQAIAELDEQITDLRDRAVTGATGGPPAPAPAAPSAPARQGLHLSAPAFRHGVRMAAAIAVAQVLTLVIPISHSFWIPLTVVFVVKPEWSFTVVRSASRVLGNLSAVLLVPAALALTAGSDWATVLLVAVIAGVAFRYFSGNYIFASFGVAGTILVLDETLGTDQSLYWWRVAATLIGAAVGLLVSAAIPTWRGRDAPVLLAGLVTGLTEWSRGACRAIMAPADLDAAGLRATGEIERNNLIRVRPAVEAALLEPRPRPDPRIMAVAVQAVERAHLSLLALGFHARLLHAMHSPGLSIGPESAGIDAELADAAAGLGIAATAAAAPALGAAATSPPTTPEDLAVITEVLRLHQATADLAEAVRWLEPAP